MATVPKPHDAPVAVQKPTFEQAVATIQTVGVTRPTPLQRRFIPIMLRVDAQSRQKRAVKDAARALSQLWISLLISFARRCLLMLRVLSVFLLVFFLLSIIVHLAQMAIVFGAVAVGLTLIDVAMSLLQKNPRPVRMRRELHF